MNAAHLFAEFASANGAEPRELMHRQLRYLADVMRGWLYDDTTQDEHLLLRQTLSHLEAARDCAEVIVPSFASLTRLADIDIDDEHDFETCAGCEQCDGPLPFALGASFVVKSTEKRLTLSPASIEGEACTNAFDGSVGTSLPPLGQGRP